GFQSRRLDGEAVLGSLAGDPFGEVLAGDEGFAASVLSAISALITDDTLARGIGQKRKPVGGVLVKGIGDGLRLPLVARAPIGARGRLGGEYEQTEIVARVVESGEEIALLFGDTGESL